jgi:hypothetical protein
MELNKSYLSVGKRNEASLFQFVLGNYTQAIWILTDLTPELFIEVLIPNQESER